MSVIRQIVRSPLAILRGQHSVQHCVSVRSIGFAAILFVMALSCEALADHPISVTNANVYVTKGSARVRIQLFAEDLNLFHELEATGDGFIPPKELQRGLKLHRKFLLEKFTLRDARGEAFEGQVTDVQPFTMPDNGISIEKLMDHSVVYELEYPFSEPPEYLTLQQDISDPNFIIPSEMKLVLHQAGAELTFQENLKPGESETIRFDWSDAQLTQDSTDEEWEAWLKKQQEETLGITSYSSVYSFIYIEPGEVRHEVLIPLANLKMVLPIEHKNPSFVDVDEQDAVRDLIKDWLNGFNATTVNGKATQPEYSRIDFYGLDLKDFAQQSEARKVSLANGRVGIIMSYRPTDDAVRDVSMTWDKFNSTVVRKIQSVVLAYGNEPARFEFSRFKKPEDNVFKWQVDPKLLPSAAETIPATFPPPSKLPLPIGTLALGALAIVCGLFGARRVALTFGVLAVVMWPFLRTAIDHPFAAPVQVADTETRSVFEQLHGGAYAALDAGTETRIYEALETAIDGPLLETLYLQLRESLAIREQGGAIARVRSVDYSAGEQTQTAKELEWPGFHFRSRWAVKGTVEHWGHIHERENQFCAVFAVEPRDGLWKITDMQIEEQKSTSSSPRLRRKDD